MSEENIVQESENNSDLKNSKPKEIPVTGESNLIESAGTVKPGGQRKPGLAPVQDGVLGSSKVESINKEKKVSSAKEPEVVALHSTKNVHWDGLGSLAKGYNIVRKDRAEKWLTRGHVRIATPEEVSKGFRK